MKIISGIYKGRNLEGYDIKGTRPTMERVKESLFAIIQNNLADSIVLDLFSGSGNLAIEALSQGAKTAYAVDSNQMAYKTIKNNVNNIGVSDCEVIKKDFQAALKDFASKNLKFDIIFLDPPYNTDYIEKSLLYIDKFCLLNDDGIIVCESDDLNKIVFSNAFQSAREKKYGDKYIVILKKVC